MKPKKNEEASIYMDSTISMGFFLAFFSGILGLIFESGSKGYV